MTAFETAGIDVTPLFATKQDPVIEMDYVSDLGPSHDFVLVELSDDTNPEIRAVEIIALEQNAKTPCGVIAASTGLISSPDFKEVLRDLKLIVFGDTAEFGRMNTTLIDADRRGQTIKLVPAFDARWCYEIARSLLQLMPQV